MNENLFLPISQILTGRRPQWSFIIEDTLIRINTMQFVVDWEIISEILDSGDFKLEEVISHSQLGLVICIRNVAGK